MVARNTTIWSRPGMFRERAGRIGRIGARNVEFSFLNLNAQDQRETSLHLRGNAAQAMVFRVDVSD